MTLISGNKDAEKLARPVGNPRKCCDIFVCTREQPVCVLLSRYYTLDALLDHESPPEAFPHK